MKFETIKNEIKRTFPRFSRHIQELLVSFEQKIKLNERSVGSPHFFHLFHIFGTGDHLEPGIPQDDEEIPLIRPEGAVVVIEEPEPRSLPRVDFSRYSSPWGREEAGKDQYYFGLHSTKTNHPSSTRKGPKEDISTPWSYMSKERFLKPPK